MTRSGSAARLTRHATVPLNEVHSELEGWAWIRNILAIKGDPPRAGDYVNATAIFDVNAIGLVRIIREMNEGRDATGNSIGEPTGFAVGVGLNPSAPDPDKEIRLLFRKVEAGACWAQTQPVYDLDALDRFLARIGTPPIPIVVGILPLHSYRHAEFLHNEVPGISVSEDVRRRLRDAGERGLAVGTALAQEILRGVRQRCQGAYLIPSFGRFEVVAEILDALH